jgi:hypothetical protein
MFDFLEGDIVYYFTLFQERINLDPILVLIVYGLNLTLSLSLSSSQFMHFIFDLANFQKINRKGKDLVSPF